MTLSDSSNSKHEETKLIYDMENAISCGIRFLQKAKERIDVFTDGNGPSLIVNYDMYKDNYIKARSRGANIRFITEITKDNIQYCKEIKKIVDELRHHDDLKGSISLSETEFIGTSTWSVKQPLIPVMYSNEKEVLEQQQFIFESLWNKSIPGEYKIKGIEKSKEEDVEVIRINMRNKEFEKISKELAIKGEVLTLLVNKLVEEDEAKDELIAMISHELKTPLVPIKGYAEMLLQPKILGEINGKQKKAIQSIKRNAEILESLVTSILDGHIIKVGKFTPLKKGVLISDFLTNVINGLKPLAEEKQASIASEINTVMGDTVYCDEKRVEQVLSNLIRNAIDFVPAKEGKIIVTVVKEKQLRKENNGHYDKGDMKLDFVFAVRDNGNGIPKDKIDSLFNRFHQIDTSVTRKHGGIGLGLAICKGIVEAHGGRIWVDETCMKGACIKFTLPVLTGYAT